MKISTIIKIFIPLSLLIATLLSIPINAQPDTEQYVIRNSREPIFIPFTLSGPSPESTDALAEDIHLTRLIETIRDQALAHPHQLIVLDPVGISGEYQGNPAEMMFEAIRRTKQALPNIQLSIRGLPHEETSSSRMSGADERIEVLINAVDVLFPDRSMILSNQIDERKSLHRAAPKAWAAARGRPILFRTNRAWRIALPPQTTSVLADASEFNQDFPSLPEGTLLTLNIEVNALPPPIDYPAATSTELSYGAGGGLSMGMGGGGGGNNSHPFSAPQEAGHTNNTTIDESVLIRKRLIHFQSVGHSSATNLNRGRVSSRVCSPENGWNAHIQHTLNLLVERLGSGTFDWWGHNIGGIWRIPMSGPAPMLFEQIDIAKSRFPALIDYTPLQTFCEANGIERYAYIGYPRSDGQAPGDQPNTPRPEHSDPALMSRWYGPLVQHGFIGVGHDWTANLKENGNWQNNFQYLSDNNIEVFIEAMPHRSSPWLLGMSVVATEGMWWLARNHTDRFYSEEEINAAGGRTIHLVLHPHSQDPIRNDPNFELQKWQFENCKRLLAEHKTVAVNLAGLLAKNLPVEELIQLSNDPPP